MLGDVVCIVAWLLLLVSIDTITLTLVSEKSEAERTDDSVLCSSDGQL
jgi:hypothetical protein